MAQAHDDFDREPWAAMVLVDQCEEIQQLREEQRKALEMVRTSTLHLQQDVKDRLSDMRSKVDRHDTTLNTLKDRTDLQAMANDEMAARLEEISKHAAESGSPTHPLQ
jgi:hypothetical protein